MLTIQERAKALAGQIQSAMEELKQLAQQLANEEAAQFVPGSIITTARGVFQVNKVLSYVRADYSVTWHLSCHAILKSGKVGVHWKPVYRNENPQLETEYRRALRTGVKPAIWPPVLMTREDLEHFRAACGTRYEPTGSAQ